MKIIHKEQCHSTQDELVSQLYQTEDEMVVVYTTDQLRGRGQYGKVWKTEAGKSLAFSIGVPEHQTQSLSASYLVLLMGTLVHQYIIQQIDYQDKLKIKWPNDIYYEDTKLCGILVEKKKIQDTWFYIIGIGINIKKYSQKYDFPSISLEEITLKKVTISEWLMGFIQKFHFDTSEQEIHTYCNTHLYLQQKVIQIQYQEKIQQATIIAIDDEGLLQLDIEGIGITSLRHEEFTIC